MAWSNERPLSRLSCPWCGSGDLNCDSGGRYAGAWAECRICHMTHMLWVETITPRWERDEGAGPKTDPLATRLHQAG